MLDCLNRVLNRVSGASARPSEGPSSAASRRAGGRILTRGTALARAAALAVFVCSLPAGGASAQFLTSDLEGTWYTFAYWDRSTGDFSGWDFQVEDIDSSGSITGGTLTDSDAFTAALTGGALAITGDGLVSGTIEYTPDSGPAFSESLSRFKMDPGKTVFVGTDKGEDLFDSLSVTVKGGGSFAIADVEGTWYFYSFWDNLVANDPGWDRGTLIMNASGDITGGGFEDSDGLAAPVTGGTVSIDAQGFVDGSIDFDGFFASFVDFKADPDKNLLAGVGTDAEQYASLSVVLKGGGSFATGDLEGTWYLYSFWDHPESNDPGWDRGTVILDASGNVTGGSVVDSAGGATSLTGGSLAITGAGIVSGTVTYSSVPNDVLSGFKMNADKDIVVGVDTDSDGYRSLSVLVKAPPPVTAKDFDDDGKADILWRNSANGGNRIWQMDGFTVSANESIGGVPTTWEVVGLGDSDGGRKTDILWRNPGTGANRIWRMDGTTVVDNQSIGAVPPAWVVEGAADFDGDRRVDILWRNPGNGATRIWRMDGFTVGANESIGVVPAVWSVAGLGDSDGDGKADILWRNTTNGANRIWRMDGTTVVDNQSIGAVPTTWAVAGMADFGGDDRADILWRNTGTGANRIWRMEGFAVAANEATDAVPTAWNIEGVGDSSGDRKADVIWRNGETAATRIWQMDGTTVTGNESVGAVPANWEVQ
jgi:hypothetical protein